MKQGVQYVLHRGRNYRIIYVRSVKNDSFKKEKVMNTTKSQMLLEALQSGEQ